MKISFEMKNLREARDAGWPGVSEFDFDSGWSDHGYWTGVWRMEDGVPVRLIGYDGGEPEDQRLYRDWFWVLEEMNALAKELQEEV